MYNNYVVYKNMYNYVDNLHNKTMYLYTQKLKLCLSRNKYCPVFTQSYLALKQWSQDGGPVLGPLLQY